MAVNEGIGAITLASRGEPTLHPQLLEMISYVSGDKFLEKKLNTNATRLTKEISKSLLDGGFNHIVFSCDSHKKDEFEELRKGASFESVLNNIRDFWELRQSQEFSSKEIRVSVSGVKTRESQDPEQFKRFWEQFCDDAYLNAAEERWDTYNNNPSDSNGSCIYPWERLYVWHDGTLNPCDVDYKSLLSPGSVQDFNSIEDAWQSLEPLRARHLDGTRSDIVPCDRCGIQHVDE